MESSLTSQRARELWESPRTFASSLLMLCVDRWGTDCIGWDPTTLIQEVEEDFGARIPQVNRDKILAAIALLASNAFHVDPIVFYQTVLAFNDVPATWESLGSDDVSAAMMAWAVMEAGLIDMDIDGEGAGTGQTPEFSDTVAAMVGVLLREDGFTDPPPLLGFAQMPRQAFVPRLAPSMEQARRDRDRMAATDLEEYLSGRLAQLESELSQLPLQSVPSPASPAPGASSGARLDDASPSGTVSQGPIAQLLAAHRR